MHKRLMGGLFLVCAVVTAGASAQIAPEEITVVPDVGEGPHLYAIGGGRVHIVDPKTFDYRGQLSGIGGTKVAITKAADRVYISNTFLSRGALGGTREDVVQIWSVPTLTAAGEIEIPPRQSPSGSQKALMSLSEDERWLFIQNATPATSVTVVDVQGMRATAEVPSPGCWGIYPLQSDSLRFASLCGDGRVATTAIDSAGNHAGTEVSDKIFDVDDDPLFVHAARDGDVLLMVSFNGNVYRIDIAGPQPRLLGRFPLAEGVEGGWKPSGGSSQLLGFVPGAGVLYVQMFPGSEDGDHAVPGKEIWAVDVAGQRVLSRTTVPAAMGMMYDADTNSFPALLVYDREEAGIVRYEINPAAGYSLRKDKVLKISGGGFMEIH